MSYFGIFVLMLWSLITYSFGFTMDRTVVFVPPAWDTAPSLDTYQRIFVDPVVKEKMRVTGMNKILQTEDAKMSENILENQTREKKSTTEKVEMKLIEMKPINEIASAMRNDASDSSEENAVITPRNIILLLIDERGQNEKKEENSWKDYKERLPFAIEGFLQNCRDKIENANFSMDNASTSEKKEKSCNCEHGLLSNLEELLTWARHTRGMTTGTVSSSNFSIPFFLKYESSRSNKSNAKVELHKSKRDSNDDLQVIDLSDRTNSVSPLITTDSSTEGDTNYDTTWDIFDVFSKIRMAFFRSLLESLHKNSGVFKDELSSRKPFFLQTTSTNLIEKTIRELKSIPNDKGYLLIAAVPRNEGAAVVSLLQREASLRDTLFVVTQICVENQTSVQFAAQGPNCQIFREARVIDELPILIKKAMTTSDCHDTECMNRQRRDISIESHVSTGGIVSQKLPAEKRVIRNMNVEKPKTDKLNGTTSNTVNTEETTIGKEIHTENSTSLKTIPFGLGTILGAMISIFVKATRTSS